MISAKFLWGNVLFGGKLQIGAKNSNFEIFESALYMKSVSMPLMEYKNIDVVVVRWLCKFSQYKIQVTAIYNIGIRLCQMKFEIDVLQWSDDPDVLQWSDDPSTGLEKCIVLGKVVTFPTISYVFLY